MTQPPRFPMIPALVLRDQSAGDLVVDWKVPADKAAIFGGVLCGTRNAQLMAIEAAGKSQPFRCAELEGHCWIALVPTLILNPGHPVRFLLRLHGRAHTLELEPLCAFVPPSELTGLQLLAVQKPAGSA